MFEIQPARFDFYKIRLSLVEERIFSHVSKFQRPKLQQETKQAGITTVFNIHSVLGREKAIWVFGILTQKEDTHYYIEDNTYSIKVNFAGCEYADPEAFFTENCVLMFKGYY
jgi:DNA polymerase epsilon subunit 2